MVVELLRGGEEMQAFAELLRPEPTADGFESEERLVICGVSWERYLALEKALDDDRPGPRFYYLNGGLEIMPRGQATIRKALKQAGADGMMINHKFSR
jgi:hypothetical protein